MVFPSPDATQTQQTRVTLRERLLQDKAAHERQLSIINKQLELLDTPGAETVIEGMIELMEEKNR